MSLLFPSKLASLPLECLQKIFREFNEESLYSCILVNRTWCQIAVPLLWYSPFHFLRKNDSDCSMVDYYSTSQTFSSNFTASTVLIQTYLRCLPDSVKT